MRSSRLPAAQPQHSPVSPRSMAGAVGGTRHGRASSSPKIRETNSTKKKKKISTNHMSSTEQSQGVNYGY